MPTVLRGAQAQAKSSDTAFQAQHTLMEQNLNRKRNADLRKENHLDDCGVGDSLRSQRPARQSPEKGD